MGCGCNGSTSTSDLWINVKADGTPTEAMPKAKALASQTANGGYIRRA